MDRKARVNVGRSLILGGTLILMALNGPDWVDRRGPLHWALALGAGLICIIGGGVLHGVIVELEKGVAASPSIAATGPPNSADPGPSAH